MKRALAVTWVMWRLVLRDALGLIFVLVVPAAVASVLGGINSASDAQVSRIGVVAEGHGPVSRRLVQHLAERPLLTIDPDHDRAGVERAVLRQQLNAAVLIPASVDEPNRSDVSLVRLVGAPGVAAPSGVRADVEAAVARTAADVTIARAIAPEDPLGRGLSLATERARRDGVATPAAARPGRSTHGHQVALFGTLVLFSFMNTSAGAGGIAHLRELGMLRRSAATPLRPRETLLGYSLYLSSFGIIQGLIVALTGSVVLGIPWAHPLRLVGVVVVIGIAAGCLGSLVGSFMSSQAAAVTVAAPLTFVMAMLGGCLWPLDIVGPTMRAVGHLVPQAWAIDALSNGAEGPGSGGLVTPLLVLAAMSLGCAAIAVARLRRVATVLA